MDLGSDIDAKSRGNSEQRLNLTTKYRCLRKILYYVASAGKTYEKTWCWDDKNPYTWADSNPRPLECQVRGLPLNYNQCPHDAAFIRSQKERKTRLGSIFEMPMIYSLGFWNETWLMSFRFSSAPDESQRKICCWNSAALEREWQNEISEWWRERQRGKVGERGRTSSWESEREVLWSCSIINASDRIYIFMGWRFCFISGGKRVGIFHFWGLQTSPTLNDPCANFPM